MRDAYIYSISFTNMGFVLMLKIDKENLTIPIYIGALEAQSISTVLLKVKPPRPLTHDLFKNILDMNNITVNNVEVYDIKKNTFYSQINMLNAVGKEFNIDSRTSDAIAVAIRCNAPIFVSEKVINSSAVPLNVEEGEKIESNGMYVDKNLEKDNEFKENISKKTNYELGKLKKLLDDAVKEERYEDAATIRDKINVFMGKLN